MNALEKAWFLRVHAGYTYEEIGKEIFYSPGGAQKLLVNGFKRLSTARIYHHVSDFCRKECTGENCRECKLYQFVVGRLLKKTLPGKRTDSP